MTWPSAVSAFIAALAVAVSVVLYVRTQAAEKNRERRHRMPVLTGSIPAGSIIVTNAGAGPALNVFLVRGVAADGGRIALARAQPTPVTWFNPVHMMPIPAGGETVIPASYLAHAEDDPWAGCAMVYTDAFGFGYTTLANGAGTRVHEGRLRFTWDEDEVPYPATIPAKRRWLEQHDQGFGTGRADEWPLDHL